MSSAYVTEPPTKGKVILHTSAGDLEIELWPKECPKTVRNFVQLCMEGYYNGTIFHRIVPNFIVQGGDPTGSGTGGSSIYGNPFVDEFHQRLRFSRRGFLAMANTGPDTNTSQFFLTLDEAMELTGKNTLFGKVVGDTLYNLLKIGESELESDDTPLYPTTITSVTILANPFDDIVPRAIKPTIQSVKAFEEPMAKKKIPKNVNLLSFDEEESRVSKKLKSSHDVIESALLSRHVDTEIVESYLKPGQPTDRGKVVPKNEVVEEEEEEYTGFKPKDKNLKSKMQELKDQIKQLGAKPKVEIQKEKKKQSGVMTVEDMRAMYLDTGKAQKGVSREGAKRIASTKSQKTMDSILKFQSMIKNAEPAPVKESTVHNEDWECDLHFVKGCGSCRDSFGEDVEDDNDDGWMASTLVFKKQVGANVYEPNIDDYTVIDPRAGIKPDPFGRDIAMGAAAQSLVYKDKILPSRKRNVKPVNVLPREHTE